MNYEMWVKPKKYEGDVQPDGPTPEEAGLDEELVYLVLDVHDNGNISSEAYFSLVNGAGEVWFISNRHLVVESLRGHNGLPIFWCQNLREDIPDDILY